MFALILMRQMEIELQVVSIAAVIISLGLLVDNGLVIVEDIQGKISRGVDPKEAALVSSKQFGTPLAVASITTVAAFIPLLILEGTSGEYAFSLGVVVAVMLAGSWLTAMYLLPPLAVWLSSKQVKDSTAKPSRLVRMYSPLVRKTLSFSVPIIIMAYVLVALSGNLFGSLRSEMFPLSARNQFLIYLDMPKGTSIRRTEQEAMAVERWLSDDKHNPEVINTTVYVGDGGPRFYLALSPADRDPASAFILVNTTDFEGALAAAKRAQRYLYEQHPAARAKVKRLSMGGEESGIVEVKISGSDADKLLAFADQIEARLHQAPGIMQNENNWGNKVLKIGLNIAQDRARSLGITSKDVSEVMNTFFNGYDVSEFRAGDEPYPITVRLNESRRDSLEDLGNLSVPTDDGLISLDQVASFTSYAEFSQLRRENQKRTIKISGKSSSLTAQELLDFIQP
ncbi:MAG: efflux RND transporter permease subunit, partial [Pseudomonadota bacterium]|nr:efflux RND transporter permease subunit [Pseudomonadota bacterium]